MGLYATVAALRARDAIPDGDPPSDALLEEKLTDAEDLVDRLVGARASSTTGRKWDPTRLGPNAVDALERATVLLAEVAYLEPGAFDPPAGKSIAGPDFTITEAAAATPAAQQKLRQAAGILDAQGLRVLTARARG